MINGDCLHLVQITCMKRTLNGDVFQNYGNDLFLLFSGFQNQAVHTIVSNLMVSSKDGLPIVNKENVLRIYSSQGV